MYVLQLMSNKETFVTFVQWLYAAVYSITHAFGMITFNFKYHFYVGIPKYVWSVSY
jgi:hypothetical protein